MSEMLERVRKAICEESIISPCEATYGSKCCLPTCYKECFDNTLDQARAAIAAMREPTKAMIEAGSEAWRAMIDAALSQAAEKLQPAITAENQQQEEKTRTGQDLNPRPPDS